MRKYKLYSRSIFPLMPKYEKTVVGQMGFSFGNQGSGGSEIDVIAPIRIAIENFRL